MKRLGDLERTRAVEQAMQDQRAILHAVMGGAGARWAQLELTMAQMKALATVADSGALPVGRLGATLGIGKPAATLLVDSLVRRDLVVRSEDPQDRRRTLVRLSERGQELVDELLRGRRDRLFVWLTQLEDDDLAALARGLHALRTVASPESEGRTA